MSGIFGAAELKKSIADEILSYAPLLVKKGLIEKPDKYHLIRWCVKEMTVMLRKKIAAAQQQQHPSPQRKPLRRRSPTATRTNYIDTVNTDEMMVLATLRRHVTAVTFSAI